MSEITKLYKNAGIKPIQLDYPDNIEPFYPEFTAEKQLNLIKWLALNSKKQCLWLEYYANDNGYRLYCDYAITAVEKDIATALASLINFAVWKVITAEEKEQIKEILE